VSYRAPLIALVLAGDRSKDDTLREAQLRLDEADQMIGDAQELLAERDPATVATLTLREALYVALQNNLDIRVEQFGPELADADVQSAEGAFDAELYFSFTHAENTDPQTTRGSLQTAGANVVYEQNQTIDAGVKGKVASGMTYDISNNQERSKGDLVESAGIAREYSVEQRLALTQPLLKNFGILVNTADIRIARANRQVASYEFSRRSQETLTAVHDAYWNVVSSRENLNVAIESLRVARDLLRQNMIRLDVGTMAPLEVLQAETGVAIRQEALITSRQQLRDAEDELKRLLNLPETVEAWNRTILPIEALAPKQTAVDSDTAVRTALAQRPEVRVEQLNLENRGVDRLVARNQLLPTLDATFEYGLRGVNPERGAAYDQSVSGTTDNYLIRTDFAYPVGNRQARGAYQRAQLEEEQQTFTLADTELRVAQEARQAVRAVDTDWQRIGVTKLASRLASEQLDAEKKKLEVGVSTSFDVLQFEEDLTDARRNEVGAQIDYLQSLAQYDLAVGRTLEVHGITIDEVRE